MEYIFDINLMKFKIIDDFLPMEELENWITATFLMIFAKPSRKDALSSLMATGMKPSRS